MNDNVKDLIAFYQTNQAAIQHVRDNTAHFEIYDKAKQCLAAIQMAAIADGVMLMDIAATERKIQLFCMNPFDVFGSLITILREATKLHIMQQRSAEIKANVSEMVAALKLADAAADLRACLPVEVVVIEAIV